MTSGAPTPPSVRETVLRLGPHAGAHRVAFRAAFSVAVPLVLLYATGHLDWAIYASFGAFVALYGRHEIPLHRLQMQLTLAVLLTSAVVAGTVVGLSEHRAWLAVPATALVAGIGSWVSDAQGWHPPGPLFLVFAFAAVASIPSEPADLMPAFTMAASAALFSVLVGGIGAWVRLRPRPSAEPRATLRPSAFGSVAMRHVARCSLGCLIAGSIATASGIGHPYWAMVSAVVPLVARDFTSQVSKGVQRLAGTALGLVTTGFLFWIDLDGLALVVCIIVLQGLAEMLIGRNYALALIVVTPLALLMIDLVAPMDPMTLLIDRGIETVIGVAVGVTLGWLTRARTSRTT